MYVEAVGEAESDDVSKTLSSCPNFSFILAVVDCCHKNDNEKILGIIVEFDT